MKLNLKGRLKLIADKVPTCQVVADIGTDHAYIPVYLIQQGICKKAIASDVKIGPVRVANRNIKLYKLDHDIETRMGSGLSTIDEGEADAIIIAGMGGTLLTELLDSDASKTCKARAMVLQPMNDHDVVRKWLYDHRFDIYDEELVAEGPKIYCVISAKYHGQVRAYSDFQLHVGQKLIERKDRLLLDFCQMKVRQIDRVLKQLESMEDNLQLEGYYSELKKNYLGLINEINIKDKEPDEK